MSAHVYPHLGFDPVASDESAGAELARRLKYAVDRLTEVDAVLGGTGRQHWEGRTADAFRASVKDELRPRVADALASFGHASSAFEGWVLALGGYRRRADALEVEAAGAAERVSSATSHLGGLTVPGHDADRSAVDRYHDDLGQARSRLDGAQGELADIHRRARDLRDEVEDHADTVAGAFDTAMKKAPDEPGLWDKLGGVLSDIKDALGAAFDWFMENLAPLIQQLARVIGAVATILAIVCFVVGFVFPPAFALAGTLGTIARVASFVDLGIQGLRVLHGEDGALQGFALQSAGMLLGIGAAKAIGPIAVNATSNIRNGLYIPQVAMAGVGSNGGAAVAAIQYTINPSFFHSLLYWGVTSYQDLDSSFDTLESGGR
ncbi:hypothetical protein [Nocardioides acrostichi]|uniref:WXG100 family type VII secretion target n=1 Tax=Nocardioides acrostichi TaxID=2784339 RepID=A0A930YA12_9ACTN|nr:hypothetical protein [Nocardioides acrostichi]MBF4160943.1 hypothetical protein [Nocardioides acrostichi]